MIPEMYILRTLLKSDTNRSTRKVKWNTKESTNNLSYELSVNIQVDLLQVFCNELYSDAGNPTPEEPTDVPKFVGQCRILVA